MLPGRLNFPALAVVLLPVWTHPGPGRAGGLIHPVQDAQTTSGCIFNGFVSGGLDSGGANAPAAGARFSDQTTLDTPQLETAQAEQAERDQQAFDQQQNLLPDAPQSSSAINDLQAQQQMSINQLHYAPPQIDPPHFDQPQCK